MERGGLVLLFQFWIETWFVSKRVVGLVFWAFAIYLEQEGFVSQIKVVNSSRSGRGGASLEFCWWDWWFYLRLSETEIGYRVRRIGELR